MYIQVCWTSTTFMVRCRVADGWLVLLFVALYLSINEIEARCCFITRMSEFLNVKSSRQQPYSPQAP